MTRPFEGVKILDFTQVLAGPYASYQFALLGAGSGTGYGCGAPRTRVRGKRDRHAAGAGDRLTAQFGRVGKGATRRAQQQSFVDFTMAGTLRIALTLLLLFC